METLFNTKVEHEKEAIGKVQGELPGWLSGTLVRTGPGKWQLDDQFALNHFLDGFAMMLRFEFDQLNQTVTGRSRYLRSEAYEKGCCQKRPVFTEFGTQAYPDQSKSFLARAFGKLVPSDLTDNDISNIYKINDNEIYMTTESCNIWQIDPHSLDSLQKVRFPFVYRFSAFRCLWPDYWLIAVQFQAQNLTRFSLFHHSRSIWTSGPAFR